MKTRAFGRTDLVVSEIGLGCARLGGIFQREAGGFLDVLAAARDAGITFYDTADMYSQGESEALIGKAFAKRRDSVVIASKAGYSLPARRKLLSHLKPLLRPVINRLGLKRERLPAAVRGTVSQDFSPGYLTRAVEASLRRLRTDYLDLLQLHSPPLEIVERGDWLGALDALKRAGKIRHFGVSVDSREAGAAALQKPGVSSLQVRINALEHDAEELFGKCASLGVAGIARECLANGALARPRDRVDLETLGSTPEERALRSSRLDELWKRAGSEGRDVSSLALDYARNVPGVSVVLVGVRTVEQLRPLMRALGG